MWKMLKYAVMAPFSTIQAEQLTPYASMVEWTGVERLWQGQSIASRTRASPARPAAPCGSRSASP
jgi:hypothetical protein